MRDIWLAVLNIKTLDIAAIISTTLLGIYTVYRFYIIHKVVEQEEYNPTTEQWEQIRKMTTHEVVRYYTWLRQEIAREDEITHQRITWSITFQGFLINGMAILLVFSWDFSLGLFVLRKAALFAVGIIGLEIGLLSREGILASRNSIRAATTAWEYANFFWKFFPAKAPQAYGQGKTFSGGTRYAEKISTIFIVMWALFLAGYSASTYVYDVRPCIDSKDIFQCAYDNAKKERVPE